MINPYLFGMHAPLSAPTEAQVRQAARELQGQPKAQGPSLSRRLMQALARGPWGEARSTTRRA